MLCTEPGPPVVEQLEVLSSVPNTTRSISSSALLVAFDGRYPVGKNCGPVTNDGLTVSVVLDPAQKVAGVAVAVPTIGFGLTTTVTELTATQRVAGSVPSVPVTV